MPRVGIRRSTGGAPLPPLDTTLLETYIEGGFGGTTQPGWKGHFNYEVEDRWPPYQAGGGFPGAANTQDHYDIGRFANMCYHFKGQVLNDWDSRLIPVMEASAHIFHKYYTTTGVLQEYQTQTTGLRMLYQLDPDVYAWCLNALAVYYNHYQGTYYWNHANDIGHPGNWRVREVNCRERAYVVISLYNYFATHAQGLAHAGHGADQNYNFWCDELLVEYPRQWLDEWLRPGFGGFATREEYHTRTGNYQNWAHWKGAYQNTGVGNGVSVNHFMWALWFDTASMLYMYDPLYYHNAQLLADMEAMCEYIQTIQWNEAAQNLWYELGCCHASYYGQAGHGAAVTCEPNYPGTGYGDRRPLGPDAGELTAFSLNMCGFLYYVTGDAKWRQYGDRNWNAFWTLLGDPLNSNNLWSLGAKLYAEAATHMFQYLKYRDYPELFCDVSMGWSPTYTGNAVWHGPT